MITIQNTLNIKSLFLTWQSNENRNKRFFVGVVSEENNAYNFRYLIDTPNFNEAVEAGFKGYPAFKLNRNIYTNDIMGTFMKRLPPKSRRDFINYLNQHHLSSDFNGSNFELITHTGIQLPSDGFDLIPDLSEAEIPFDYMMEIAGTRYYINNDQLSSIKNDDEVTLKFEVDNEFDPCAIAVYAANIKIGYINRLQCDPIRELLNSKKIKIRIAKKSGTVERPLLYIMLSVS